MPMTISAITASVSAAVSAAAPAAVAASATAAATTTFGVTSLLAAQAIYGAAYVATAAAEAALLGAAASALQSRPSPGVQWRTAQSPLETRRIPCGKVYTTGRSMGDPITWGNSNKHAIGLIALADVPIGGISSFKVAGNDDTFFGLLINGYPAAFRNTDPDSRGYEISETVNPFTRQRVDDFLVGRAWKFHVRFHLGHDDQVADSWMVSEIPAEKWDATAVGKNLAYARAYTYYDSDIFTGFPTFAYYLDGALMYNPAKDSSVGGSGPHRWGILSTYEVSTNPAVIAYNVARGFFNSKGEMVYGSGYEADDLPLDFWIPSIHDCDELITDKDGTQSPRYSCSFEVDITDEPRKYLKICETAMAGRICEDRGQLLAYAGVSQTPIFSFTDADKVQGASNLYDKKLGIDNLKNTVTGKFLSVAECFVQLDAPPRESAADIAEDGGIPLTDAMDLSMIQHGPTAQRVMEATRRRHRAQATCTRTFRLSAQNARKGQWISGTSKDWDGTKWFEIIKAVPNLYALTVTMALREVPFNLSDWSAARDELDKYTVTLPSADPLDPLKMTGIVAAPLGEQGGDGSTAPGITVTYAVTDDPSAKQVELQIAKVLASGTHGSSVGTTAFSDNTAAAFNPNMVGRVIVIEGAGEGGGEYTGTIAGYTSATSVTLSDPTVTAAAGCAWMVLGDTQCVYASDPTSGVIKAGNLLGQTLYAYRVRVQGIEGRASEFSDWKTISTGSGAIADGSVTGPKIADGTIDPIAKFIAGMDAIKVVTDAALPTTKITNTIFWTVTCKQYTWDTATSQYKIKIDTSDLTGSIVSQQIADASLTTAKFAAGLEPVTVATGSLPTVKSTETIVYGKKLYTWNSSAGAYKVKIDTSDLSGTITGPQIAAATITSAQIAAAAVGAAQLAAQSVGSINLVNSNLDNLIPNGNSEIASPTGGWPSGSSEAAGLVTASSLGIAARSGTHCRTFTAPSGLYYSPFIPCGAGDQFYFECWAQPLTVPNSTLYTYILFFDAGGSQIYTPRTDSVLPAGSFTKCSVIGTAPANAAFVRFHNNADAGNGSFAIDDLYARRVVEGSIIADGTLTAQKIADATLTIAKFAAGLEPVTIITGSLPTSKSTSAIVYGDELYRWNGSSYVKTVQTSDLSGSIIGSQIAAATITAQKLSIAAIDSSGNIASGVVGTVQLAANAVTAAKTSIAAIDATTGALAAGTVSASQIVSASITSTQISSGTIQGSNIASGTIATANIADGALSVAKFATGIEPVTIVTGALPTTKSTTTIAYNGDLYRWSGSSYVKTISTTDLSGTITGSQIAASTVTASKLSVAAIDGSGNLASGVVGTLQLASSAVTAAKLSIAAIDTNGNVASGAVGTSQIASGAVTGSQIAASTITASKLSLAAIDSSGNVAASAIGAVQLATAAVTASKTSLAAIDSTSGNLNVNTVSASQIVAACITSALIAAATITGANIAAGTITSSNIAAQTITANQISAGAIGATQLAANSVAASNIISGTIVSSNIAAGTIVGANIASGTITSAQIAAGTITASNIASDTITASQIAAGAIGASELAANSVSATNIVVGTIVGSKIAAATITGSNVAAGTITANNIAADTITAGQIAAGAVGASEIAAGSIFASHLTISNLDNLIPNGNSEQDVTGCPAGSYETWGLTTNGYARSGTKCRAFTSGGGGLYFADVKCSVGDQFYFEFYAWNIDVPNATILPYILFFDNANNLTGTASNPTVIPGGLWVKISVSGVAPAGSTHLQFHVNSDAGNGSFAIDDLYARRMADGSLIVDGAITATKIAAATITATQIAASAIGTTQLAANSVTAGKIAANTITASQIASATITTTQIAAGTIVGSNIAAGTITASNIAADTITANEIAASAIGTSELAANAVTATKIAAGTITSDLIAANTITGSNIAAATITASNIAADTITAAQIAVGAVGASEVAAGAITASKLAITGENICADPYFQDFTWWNNAAQWTKGSNPALTGTPGYVYATNPSSRVHMWVAGLGLLPNKTFECQITISNGLSNQGVTATIRFWHTDGTYNDSGIYCPANTPGPTNYSWQNTAPSNCSTAEIIIYTDGGTGTTGTVWATGCVLRQAATGTMIVDGAITATKIAAATITATQIASATITGTQIASQTITASNIAADTITAGQIASGAISTDELAANAVTAAKIAAGTITGDRMVANTITGSQIAAGTITGDKIAAGAITADMITTGTLNAALIKAGTIDVARLPGLSTLNFYTSSQLTNWWPGLAEQPSAILVMPATKFDIPANSITAISTANSVPFAVNSSSATIVIEMQCTYQPQTSAQVSMWAGFMYKNTSTSKYTYLDESLVAVSTGSNAIYQTITARCRIPTAWYTQILPYLFNTSGDPMHVKTISVQILQNSK